MPNFSDENIEMIFGAEAAESESDDRFKQYFYFNDTYSNLRSQLPMRILVGHKGVGKSALIKRAYLSDIDEGIVALKLGPSDFSNLSTSRGASDFNRHVVLVKNELLGLITRRILGSIGENYINESIGYENSVISKISDVIAEKVRLAIQKYGNGSQAAVADAFLKSKTVHVYIDDIDRGWSASPADIKNISALLNAMRDISGTDNRIRFRIGLRSDVYFLVRTSDESTDKIESHIVWLEWSLHEILCIMALRIATFFNIEITQEAIFKLKQEAISSTILSKVIDPVFLGRGHWAQRPIHNVLLSLARKRPRDLVKLMHGAAKKAQRSRSNIIGSKDLENSFESYSNERLQDIVNEFKTEMPAIEQFLLNLKPAKKQRLAAMSYLFTKDELANKLKSVSNNVTISFTNKKNVNTNSLIQFLYKIDFITARLQTENGIERRYFDSSRFLANEFADFGFEWEIHPAYRWALQPQDINSIFDNLGK
jgi:hypothetical protein